MKKAILAAVAASAAFFGSEAMESSGLIQAEPRTIVGFICGTQPLVSIYRMADGMVCLTGAESEVYLQKNSSVFFIGGATFNGLSVTGDTFEINPGMTDKEIIDKFQLGLNCEITVGSEYTALERK